ncbi:hypothetical protein P7L79_17550 [Tistrella mobilis]|uniref:hypothetical protein n=1 Tax=Tistrella mobilis TaxID=171437 RepID=UPI0035586D60
MARIVSVSIRQLAAGDGHWLQWQIDPPPPDAGLPAIVAGVFAEGLVRRARVTLIGWQDPSLSGHGWVQLPGRDLAAAMPEGRFQRLVGRLRGLPRPVCRSTTDADVFAEIITRDASWSDGAQICFLSARTDPPPFPRIFRVLRPREGLTRDRRQVLVSEGVTAVVRPEDEGRACRIVSIRPGAGAAVLDDVGTSARVAGFVVETGSDSAAT